MQHANCCVDLSEDAWQDLVTIRLIRYMALYNPVVVEGRDGFITLKVQQLPFQMTISKVLF